MGFLDDFLNKTKNVVDTTTKKTGEFVELQKVNMKISETVNSINKAYLEIGRMLYESSKGRGEFAEEIDQKISAIDDFNETLTSLKDEANDLKGVIICTKCGKENPEESAFCASCGNALKG